MKLEYHVDEVKTSFFFHFILCKCLSNTKLFFLKNSFNFNDVSVSWWRWIIDGISFSFFLYFSSFLSFLNSFVHSLFCVGYFSTLCIAFWLLNSLRAIKNPLSSFAQSRSCVFWDFQLWICNINEVILTHAQFTVKNREIHSVHSVNEWWISFFMSNQPLTMISVDFSMKWKSKKGERMKIIYFFVCCLRQRKQLVSAKKKMREKSRTSRKH